MEQWNGTVEWNGMEWNGAIAGSTLRMHRLRHFSVQTRAL